MRLKTAIAKATVGGVSFQTGDGFLQSASVVESEQERASSCQLVISDPQLKFLNLLLTQFQKVGGIYVPSGLLQAPQATASAETPTATTGVTSTTIAAGSAANYLKELEKKYGISDLSGLTETGKRAYAALGNTNVRAFLDAIAIAELGDPAGEPGKGYGYLFGDTGGKETFDPKTMTTHPRRSRPFRGGSSTATGRYQIITKAWDDDAYGYRRMGLKDMKPISQEIFAVGRMIYRRILEYVERGEFSKAITGNGAYSARYEWASLAGNPYNQGTSGGNTSTFLANVAKYKARYSTGNVAPSTATTATTPTTPPSATSTTKPATTTSAISLLPDTSGLAALKDPEAEKKKADTIDVSQGTRIIIELGFNDSKELTAYEFLLTDIRGGNDNNTTRIGGKQVRAAIAKGSKVFTVHRNISIRQLAANIGAKVGAKVEVADTVAANQIQKAISQQESDYAFLLKLAKEKGLFLRGTADKLKIEALKPSDKAIVITRSALSAGSNWGDSAAENRILEGQGAAAATTTATPTAGTTTSGSATSTGFVYPCSGILTQRYKEGTHNGLDIADDSGTIVVASAAGTVLKAGSEDTGLGIAVYIQHPNGIITVYGHNRKALVKPGQIVNQKQLIAEMGSTGNSTGPHVHFEVYQNGKTIDPMTVLPVRVAEFSRVPFSTATPTPTPSTPPATSTTSALPDTSALQNIKDKVDSSKVKEGILELTTKPDEAQGVGKGFEGIISVSTIDLPSILQAQPGIIASLMKDTGFGGAIARDYRISEVQHNYSAGVLQTALSIYLPVAIKAKAETSSSSTETTTGTSATSSTPTTSGATPGGLPIPKKTGSYMYFSPLGKKDEFGANVYKLALIRDGKEVDSVEAVSGYNRLSAIARGKDYSGSGRPCPTGVFKMDAVRVGGNAYGVGKYWIHMPGTNPRSAIGIHSDWNRYAGSSGTAGCLGVIDPRESSGSHFINKYTNTLKVVGWRNSGVDVIVVNHGIKEDEKYLQGWI